MIKELEIKNYKGFEDLKIPDIKRINLIGGKNNIGKTSLLELIFEMNNIKNNFLFLQTRVIRGINKNMNSNNIRDDIWGSNFYNHNVNNRIIIKELTTENTNREMEFVLNNYNETNSNLNIVVKNNNKNIFENNLSIVKKFQNSDSNSFINQIESKIVLDDIPKLKKCKILTEVFNDDLTVVNEFGEIEKEDLKAEIIDCLKAFFPKLLDINYVVIDNIGSFLCKIDGIKKKVDLNELGLGVKQLLKLLLSIYNCQNGIVLIDEIGYGIHYQLQEEIWKILIELSKNKKVQIFATTHSLEMIQAFNKKSLENDNNKYFSYIELFENHNQKKIEAIVMDSEKLQFKLDNNYNVRGE